jgi:hypothetical protein
MSSNAHELAARQRSLGEESERLALTKPSWWTRTRELRWVGAAADGELVGRLYLRGLLRWSGVLEAKRRTWLLRRAERGAFVLVDADTGGQIAQLGRRSGEQVLVLADGDELRWRPVADGGFGFVTESGKAIARFHQRRVLLEGPIVVEVSTGAALPSALLALLGGYLITRATQRDAGAAAGAAGAASVAR